MTSFSSFKACSKHGSLEKTEDKREVVSSSSQPDVHTLLLVQLQDKLSNIQSQYQVADNNLQHEITAQAAELRQEVKSESAKLQQQLGDVRQQVSTELAAVDRSIQKINKTMVEFHKIPAGRF